MKKTFLLYFTIAVLSIFSNIIPIIQAEEISHNHIPENVFGFILTDNGLEMLPLPEPSWPEKLQKETILETDKLDDNIAQPQEGPIFKEDPLKKDTFERKQPENGKEGKVQPCLVRSAQVHLNGQSHNPLRFPWHLTSPMPGGANKRQIGSVIGPVPRFPDFYAGSNFEFDATLNGEHGCSSRQFKKSVSFSVINMNAGNINGDVRGPFIPDAKAGIELYRGTTQTGVRRLPGGPAIYEGTPNNIRWLDAPGLDYRQNRGAIIEVQLQYFVSAVYDTGGTAGWVCFTGQLMAIDTQNTRPVPPAQLKNIVTNMLPTVGANAATRFNINFINNLVRLRAFDAQTNPNFRTVRCRRMDPIPATLR